MKHVFYFLIVMLSAASCLDASLFLPEKKIYPYRYDPEDHYQFSEKHFVGPSWSAYGDRMWEYGVEYLKFDPYELYDKRGEMDTAIKKADYVHANLNKITRIAGVDKNSYPANMDLREFVDNIDVVRKHLNGRYMGGVIGEQDAAWVHMNERFTFPFSRDKAKHYASLEQFMDAYGRLTDYQMGMNSNLWGSHYLLKPEYTTVSGFQIRSYKPYQFVYAFMRGAVRQYPAMFTANLSDVDFAPDETFAQKAREKHEKLSSMTKEEYQAQNPPEDWWQYDFQLERSKRHATGQAAEWNTSCYSVIRRTWNAMYLYGVSYLDVINFKFRGTGEPTAAAINRVAFDSFVDKYPDPGGVYTPVACMLDFFSGWVPFDHGYYTWDGVPYEEGDYLLGEIAKELYPGLITDLSYGAMNAANLFKDFGKLDDYTKARLAELSKDFTLPVESLHETPYGEIMDVLLGDAKLELMNQYAVIIAAGKLWTELPIMRSKIDAYVKQGGNFIVTADNAKRLWPEWGIKRESQDLGYTFDFPSHSNIAKRAADRPIVVEIPNGKGAVTVLLSAFGLEGIDRKYNPYRLSEAFKELLRKKFESLKLYSVGDGLAHVLCRDDAGYYTLGIFNHGYIEKPFKIESLAGPIKEIVEITPDADELKKDPLYLPRGIDATAAGYSTDSTIAGGDVRLFRILLEEDGISVMDHVTYEKPTTRSYLNVELASVRDIVLGNPSFRELFTGVKIDAEDLREVDDMWLDQCKSWFKGNRINVLVDARAVKDLSALSFIADKAKCFEYLDGLVLTPHLFASVDSSGGKFVSAEEIHFFESMNELNPRSFAAISNGIMTVDYEWKDWDSLCDRILHDGKFLSEKKEVVTLNVDSKTKLKHLYLSVRDCDNLITYLREHPGYVEAFKGVLIDVDYLHAASMGRCLREANWLKENDMSLIVDFSSRIKFYRDISYESTMPFADEGKEMLANVFEKMKLMGVTDAVLIPPYKDNKRTSSALAEIAREAKDSDITLHMRMIYAWEKLDKAKVQLEQVGASNIKVAWHPLVSNMGKVEVNAGNPFVDLVFLSDRDERNMLSPISHIDKAKWATLERAINSGKKLILDAEYLDSDELKGDYDVITELMN